MAETSLDKAIKDLLKWYQLYSLEDMIKGDISNVQTDAAQPSVANLAKFLNPQNESSNKQNSIENLISAIINTQRGSFTSYQLMKEIVKTNNTIRANTAGKASIPIFSFFIDDKDPSLNIDGYPGIIDILGISTDDTINSNLKQPTKEKPTVSVHLVNSRRISLSNKNPNALSIFLNTIPTHEWSRAIPFISIKFQYQRPPLSADGHISTPSLVKFLEGSKQVSKNSLDIDFLMQAGKSPEKDLSFSGDEKAVGESGTELFLAPQTLINPNDDDQLRSAPVLDKFRPLASLKRFEVNVVPAAGIIAHRTAKLSFVLHDRTRLNEISDFIKAGVYNKTEMLIEYGWSHPDTDSVFGNFINELKIKEKYQIMNNHFQIKQNGEVDVDLDLFTKGAVDLYTSKIAEDGNVMSKSEAIKKLQEKISELSKQLFKASKESNLIKEVRGQQILSTASDQNADLQLSKELKRELESTLSNLNQSPSKSAKDLAKALKELFGTDGTNGDARDLRQAIASAIENKMNKITGQGREEKPTPDPFILSFEQIIREAKQKGNLRQILDREDRGSNFVSLAKLMLLFIAQPLIETGKFNDVQFIFYPFNENAGPARTLNIGHFPIDIKSFQKNYKRVASMRRTANLSLREFISFVSNRYLEDISSPVYGLRDLYRYETNKETGEEKAVLVKSLEKNPTKLAGLIELNMKKSGIPDGVFKLPQIDMYVEAVPGTPQSDGESIEKLEELTILRIHIFDKQSTAFASQGDFLSAQRDDSLRSLGDEANKVVREDETASDLQQLLEKAGPQGANLVERISTPNGEHYYKFIGGPQAVKDFVAKTMPTLIYGSSNTSVIEAGLETIQDQKLATINMVNAGDKGDLTPNGGATNGLPVRVFPAQMNMRSFGCPIMEFTQTIFCDYQTNTSIDNIYAATKIQHVIEPGKFTTSTTMTPLDAYGQYQSVVSAVGAAITKLEDMSKDSTD